MLKFIRFALLGAAAAVIVSGTLGLDTMLPDTLTALLGGTAGMALSKLAILA